jgi:hypothetical protein
MGEGKGGGACVRVSVDSLHSHYASCTPSLALPRVKQREGGDRIILLPLRLSRRAPGADAGSAASTSL